MAKEEVKEEVVAPDQQETVQPAPEVKDSKTRASAKDKTDTVEVKKDVLNQILDTLKRQESEIERLQYAADKGRLAKFNEKNQSEPVRRVSVNYLNNQIVMAWTSMTANEVYKDFRTGAWHEKLESKVVLADGSELVIPYEQFINLPYLECDVIDRMKSDSERITYKLVVAEGQPGIPAGYEFTIDGTFINHK